MKLYNCVKNILMISYKSYQIGNVVTLVKLAGKIVVRKIVVAYMFNISIISEHFEEVSSRNVYYVIIYD